MMDDTGDNIINREWKIFNIPVQKEELIPGHNEDNEQDNVYYMVKELKQIRNLPVLLQDAVRAFNSSGVEFVFEHFDTFFSILIHGNKLEWPVINKGFEYVERACQHMCRDLENIFKEKEISATVRSENLNCLKMLLYLHTNIMKVKDSKLQAESAASLTIGKRGKKANNIDNNEKEGEWRESDRRTALDVIYNFLQLPLHRLWDPPLVDDTFVDMLAQPCYKAMEDSSIKNKVTRESVFQVLGILNKKYNHGMSCTIKLVQMVQLYEHAVSPICSGIEQLVTVWGLSGMVAKLVRELGEALGNGEANEGPGDSVPAQRHCAQLLSELTQLLPAHMIPAAQAMRTYLDTDESYPLRCSVLGMMCEILCKELKGEGLTEEKKQMRDEFLDDLDEHIHDMSAYVRTRALQYWCRLQKEGCIPVARQQSVLAKGIGRLQDKATLVRKNAILLVKVFLEHNPFSAQLKLDILDEQLSNEKKTLESLHSKLNPTPNPKLLEKWDSFEPDLISNVKEKITDDSDYTSLLEQNINKIYKVIRQYIDEEKYTESFTLVQQAEAKFPEAKLFHSEVDKRDKIKYYIDIIKKVYTTDKKNEGGDDNNDAEMELIKSIDEKESIVAFLEESVEFIRLMQQAVPLIFTLLMSKQATDVYEAIDFFITAHSFNIESAKIGVMGMLQLVWSPDQEKREAVEKAYRKMYLESEGSSDRGKAGIAAKKLVILVLEANRGHAAALQALLKMWLQNGDIGMSLIQILWEMFTKKHAEATDAESHAALALLVMLAKAKPSIASANMEIIQNVGLNGSYKIRVLSIEMLLSLSQSQKRMPTDTPLLQCLVDNVTEAFFIMEDFPELGTKCIDVIYSLCETPDILCLKLMKNITDKMISENCETEDDDYASYPIKYLSRYILLLGQIAMQQLIYLDVTVYGELRRRNEVREQRKAAGTKNKIQLAPLSRKSGRVAELASVTLNCSNASSASSRLRPHNTTNQTLEGDEPEEDEMGLEGAVADDADAELVRAVCENEIVLSSGDAGILAKAGPFLRSLVLSGNPVPAELRSAACLALCRFMLVSSSFCEDNMQILMTLLKNSTCSSTRCNIIITLSDLTLRFPNVIQPWTHFIYERLDDPCVEVRQCTVKMLSFLILQEMVRVRGQVANLARCCVDDDLNTKTMAKLFFKQLSQKGNALYNIIPDIISRLSDPSAKLDEDHFRIIMKYIMSLIQKDKQMEALVEKLCLRFKLSCDERQWRDLAYCLSLFVYNERSIKKLIENMDCYKEKLFNKEVYDCFKTIITNANKNAKADVKTVVSELSDKIEECFAIREPGAQDDSETNEALNRSTQSRTPARTPVRRKAPPKRKPRKSCSDDSDPESGSDSENRTPVKNRKRPTESTRGSTRKKAALSYRNNDDSDASGDDEFVSKKNTEKDVFKKPIGRARRKKN